MIKKERIAKTLARCGIASRRKAEELIRRGLVEINSKKITHPANLVDPVCDVIKVRGNKIQAQGLRCIILNKPRGVLSTVTDARGRKTVLDLIDVGARRAVLLRLYPVGRLDKDTTGLILITNDGELTNRLIHPRYEVPRVYEVEVEGLPCDATLKRVRRGILLEDGKTAPCKCSIIKKYGHRTLLSMTLHEGKKREIRRVWDAVGYPVYNLKRIAFGPLKLGSLALGKSRDLTDGEVARLKKSVGLQKERKYENR